MSKLDVFIPAERKPNGKTIPLPGMNEIIEANRKGKQVGASHKANEQRRIGWYIKQAMKSQHWKTPEKPVTIAFFWHEKNRRRDYDNIIGYQKYLLDALVEVGAIKDDSQRYIERIPAQTVIIDADSPGVRVVMFDSLEDE